FVAYTTQEFNGALAIGVSCRDPFSVNFDFRFAVVVAEVKLGRVTLQVLLADMMERAIDATLENREEALDGVGVDVAAHVFLTAVSDGVVASRYGAEDAVLARV